MRPARRRPLNQGAGPQQCIASGSIILCQAQALGEPVPVAGTPYRLEYWSDRAKKATHSLKIAVSGPGPMPQGLKEIRAVVEVAGQRLEKTFPSSPNQSFVFEWNGKDAFGRVLQGPQPVKVELDNVYSLAYATTVEFGDLTDSAINVDIPRGEFLITRYWTTKIGNLASADQGLGGWDFDVHHVYDPNLRTLYFGSGYKQESVEMPLLVRGFAGTGEVPAGGVDADEIPALQAKLGSPSGLAVAPDGSVYIANENSGTVRRVARDGTITTVVGQAVPNLIQNPGCEICANPACTGPVEPYWKGDVSDWVCWNESGGTPAYEGHHYFNDHAAAAGREVYQDIDVSAYSAAIASGNQRFSLGAAALGYGSVYQSLRLVAEFRDAANENVLDAIDITYHPPADWGTFAQTRVAPAGTRWIRVRLVAEDGSGSYGGVMADDLSLRALGPDGQGEGPLKNPRGLAVGPDGSLYIAADARVWKRSPDGALTPFAGTGEWGYGGDGGPATSAKLRKPMGVALGADGSLYIADVTDNRVRRVGPNGNISTILGDGSPDFDATEGELAKGQPVNRPTGIAVAPKGAIYVSGHDRIVRIGPDGILTIYAGGSDPMPPPVDSAPLAILSAVVDPTGLAFAPDGTLFAADRNRLFKVTTEGRFIQLTRDSADELRDGVAVSRAAIAPESLALLPTGELLFADREMNRVRLISQALPGVGASDMLIASHDGKEVYVFDRTGRHLRTADAMTGVTALQFGYDSQGRLATLTDRDGDQTRVERDDSGAPTAIVAPFGQRTALSLGSDGMLKSIADPMGGQVSMTYSKGLMATYTDARGGLHRFAFDDAGLLIKDEDPTGASKTLTRTTTATGFNVDVTTALGSTTSHKVDFSPLGTTRWTNTAPDGTTAVSKYDLSDWEASYPDGSSWTAAEQPDPRFGAQAPMLGHSTFTTPGWLTADAKTERTVVLSDAANPLSVKQLTEKTTVNDKVTTSTWDAVARTLTLVSPTGRQVVQTFDAKGRVIRREVTGLSPVIIAYDDHGRPTSVRQGARQVSLGYDANGYLSSIVDPLSRAIGLQKDLLGRVTKQTGPDGTQTLFGYDRASNITGVTPPGRQAYTYGYSSVDLETSFAPPAVGTWDPATNYTYDLDQALTNVSRPDATSIGVKYDTGGRPVEVDHPSGPIALGYDSSGRLARAATPEEALDWSYDGSLVTQTKWSGAVNGSVEYSYDSDFRLTGTTVNGTLEALRSYDEDGLLVQTGDLAINRDPKNGVVVSTDAGVVHETYGYNEFGEVTSFTVTNQATSEVLLDIRYTRDGLGRITKKVETTDGTTKTSEYGYDLANRLAEVRTNGVVTASWTYDANGNRTSETKGGNDGDGDLRWAGSPPDVWGGDLHVRKGWRAAVALGRREDDKLHL